MRTLRVIIVSGLIAMLAVPALAQTRQAARTVHRASPLGGTGLTYMRIGDQLDPEEMNASVFLSYAAYSKMPLHPFRVGLGPDVDDPRGDSELWMTLTYNYGINHIFEVGAQIPLVFISDLRDAGVGRIGLDGRVLILNVDRMGMGVSATVWANFPSFQKANSSHEFNAGGELSFMAKGESGTNYFGLPWLDRWILEPMRAYAVAGWGFEDYIKFGRLATGPVPVFGIRNPDDADIVGTEVLYGGLAVDYEVYDQLFIGGGLFARQWPDYNNDNNFVYVLPEISYTYMDKFTTGLTVAFTDFQGNDHQPDYQITAGFTYHFPELVRTPTVRPESAPPVQQDLIDVFTPSRKPIPTEAPETEVPVTPTGGGEEEDIETEPIE